MKKTIQRYNPPNTCTIGRDQFAKISAVEGIALSDEMKRDFLQFDIENLSANERRQRLISKYGKGQTSA